jgi:hypothetical protein
MDAVEEQIARYAMDCTDDSVPGVHWDEKPASAANLSKCGVGVICYEVGRTPVITCKDGVSTSLGTIYVEPGKTLAFVDTCSKNSSL